MNASLLLLACLVQDSTAVAPPVAGYVPPRGAWEVRSPAELGMDPERLLEAVSFARAQEAATQVDLAQYIRATFGREPHSTIVGPTRERAGQNGIILRGGYIVAEWGDTRRPDMTFSVTKTYLSTVVGLALQEGLIGGVHESVGLSVPSDHFEGERHARITWDHLLRQTSDWRGTLFGKPDWADRPPRGATTEAEMRAQPLREPGASWEYNDVRVNLLAYAALELWRAPLPQVLRERILDPIGASGTWRWHGYTTSWVTLDGLQVQSVSGGGHHGGGMFISTRDQARFGLLCLRDGVWGERRLLASDWIRQARTPTPANPGYGFMNWFLNGERETAGGQRSRPWPSAPESAVLFRGAGSNIVYVDTENDLVMVVRWIASASMDELIGKLLAALQ